MEHTPEPWGIYNDTLDGYIVSGLRLAGPGEHTSFGSEFVFEATIFGGESSEGYISDKDPNALRAIAAVNACEGIPTEALEDGVVKELLEALEEIFQESHETGLVVEALGNIRKTAKAAYDKATQ